MSSVLSPYRAAWYLRRHSAVRRLRHTDEWRVMVCRLAAGRGC